MIGLVKVEFALKMICSHPTYRIDEKARRLALPEETERRASGIIGRETRGNPEPTYALSGWHLKSRWVNPAGPAADACPAYYKSMTFHLSGNFGAR